MGAPEFVRDRLYSVQFRPQELALYGEKVEFSLRYGVVADDPKEPATEHFRLLVLHVTCELPEGHEMLPQGGQLELLKCGWELHLETAEPTSAEALEEGAGEVPRLLARVAETVNELAARGGLEAPLGTDVQDRLIAAYRRNHRTANP